jgi:hypothetical protein
MRWKRCFKGQGVEVMQKDFQKLSEMVKYFDVILNAPGHDGNKRKHQIDIDSLRRIYDEILLFLPMEWRDKFRNRPETWKTRSTRRITNDVKELIQKAEAYVHKTAPDSENLWTKPVNKNAIWEALAEKKIVKYSGTGKPTASPENAVYIMKALHELTLIDESLIYITILEKKEKWSYSFIISEIVLEGKENLERKELETKLAQAKKYHFSARQPDREHLEKIKTIIKSTLHD